MQFTLSKAAIAACLLLASCGNGGQEEKAGQVPTGSAVADASHAKELNACLNDLDAHYRTPMLKSWTLVKKVFGDGSGERPGNGGFIHLNADGTYTQRDGDREAGRWMLNYTSGQQGGLDRLLLLFADHKRYGSPYWEYHMLTVTFADVDGEQHLVLTKAGGTKWIYAVEKPLAEY